jgi:polyisoprenoid-binding protein YceI
MTPFSAGAIAPQCLFALLLAISANARSSEWKLDPAKSSIGFRIGTFVVGRVDGTVGPVHGTLHLDDRDLAHSRVDATIDMTPIDTGNAKRDRHLATPDFFDVAKFSTATFHSTKVARQGPGRLEISGDLTLHGKTAPVTLECSDPLSGEHGAAAGDRLSIGCRAKVDRGVFGLRYEGSGIFVSWNASVTLKVELSRTPPSSPEWPSQAEPSVAAVGAH